MKKFSLGVCILAASIIFSGALLHTIAPRTVYAQALPAGVLYEDKNTKTVTDGVVYNLSRRIYEKGMVDIHTITIDLLNPNVELGVLSAVSAVGVKEGLLKLTKDNKAVAAINGDFFDGGSPQTSLGVVVEDGTVTQISGGFNTYSTVMPSFFVDNDLNAFIDCLRNTELSIKTGTATIPLAGRNKIIGKITLPAVFDSSYGSSTKNLDTAIPNLTKVVIDNNIIQYISLPGETVQIPENGLVLVMNPTSTETYRPYLHIQREAYLAEKDSFLNSTKNVSDVAVGITGGGWILKNGQAVSDGLLIEPTKRHPRSAVGISKDGRYITLMAVDGRTHSIGATHGEMQAYLLEYGAYNAMHFDGGGSTTLVAREPVSTTVKVQNTLSEGAERSIVNGLGVYSVGADAQFSDFSIGIGQDYAFANIPMVVTLKALDQYKNLSQFPDGTEMQMDVSGINGSWDGYKFTPEHTGTGFLTVTIGGIQRTMEFIVLDEPVFGRLSPSSLTIARNETRQFNLIMSNFDNFSTTVDASSVSWAVTSDNAEISPSGVLTALKNGKTFVTATWRGQVYKAEVAIGTYDALVDSFEADADISFISHPATVGGSVAYSTQRYSGERGLALNYSFQPNSTQTQAAYIDFSKSSTTPDGAPVRLAMLVKGDKSGYMLKARVIDAKGKEFLVELVPLLNYDDWRYVNVKLPDGVSYPVKIDRVYVAALQTQTTVPSTIYIDNLAVSYYNPLTEPVPSSRYVDNLSVDSTAAVNGAFNLTVFGPTIGKTTVADLAIKKQIVKAMEKNGSFGVFTGATDIDTSWSYLNTMSWVNQYKLNSIKNLRIINYTAVNGKFSNSSSVQWSNLKKDLESITEKNIIILMDKDLWNTGSFTNRVEAETFHSALKKFRLETGKTIFVLQGVNSSNASNRVTVKDGIRYFTLSGMYGSGNSGNSVLSLLRLSVSADKMQYRFVPITVK